MFLKNLLSKFCQPQAPPSQKTNPAPRITLLIDAENVSPLNIHAYMKELTARGVIIHKEAYGNGRLLESKTWKNALLLHAIKPCMTLPTKKGKSTADNELELRAQELYYEEKPDLTCIISGDSDYSVIVQKLRAKNHDILVILKQNVPISYLHSVSNVLCEETLPGIHKSSPRTKPLTKTNPLVTALSAVTTVPVVTSVPAVTIRISSRKPVTNSAPATSPVITSGTTPPKTPPIPNHNNTRKQQTKSPDMSIIDRAYEMTIKESTDYPSAINFSNTLRKLDPHFHFRNYGCTSFKNFLVSLHPRYEIIRNENKNIFVRKIS